MSLALESRADIKLEPLLEGFSQAHSERQPLDLCDMCQQLKLGIPLFLLSLQRCTLRLQGRLERPLPVRVSLEVDLANNSIGDAGWSPEALWVHQQRLKGEEATQT